MVETKMYCDRCGKEMPDRLEGGYRRIKAGNEYALDIKFKPIKGRYPYNEHTGRYTPIDRWVDLCDNCIDELEAWWAAGKEDQNGKSND